MNPFFFFLVRSLKPQKFQHFPCSVASTTWDHYICSSSRPNQPFRPELAFPFLSDVQLSSVLCVANVTLSHLTRLSLRVEPSFYAPAKMDKVYRKTFHARDSHTVTPNLWHRDLTTCLKVTSLWIFFCTMPNCFWIWTVISVLEKFMPWWIVALKRSFFFFFKDCLWVDHACESWL